MKRSNGKPRRWPMGVSVFLITCTGILLFTLRVIDESAPNTVQPAPPPPPPKEYIDKSYYDLREEEEGLYDRSGLTTDDTEARWEAVMKAANANFRRKYEGKHVTWTGGYVSDVKKEYGRFICTIEMDKDAVFSTTDIRFRVSRSQAMSLKKYKEVLLNGKIKSLNGSLKVELEDVTISYTGRTLEDMCKEETDD